MAKLQGTKGFNYKRLAQSLTSEPNIYLVRSITTGQKLYKGTNLSQAVQAWRKSGDPDNFDILVQTSNGKVRDLNEIELEEMNDILDRDSDYWGENDW